MYSEFKDVKGYEGYLKINDAGEVMLRHNGKNIILGRKRKIKEKKQINTWEGLLNSYTLG